MKKKNAQPPHLAAVPMPPTLLQPQPPEPAKTPLEPKGPGTFHVEQSAPTVFKVRVKRLCLSTQAAGKFPYSGVLQNMERLESGPGVTLYMTMSNFGMLFEIETPLWSLRLPSTEVVWFEPTVTKTEEEAQADIERRTRQEAAGLRARTHGLSLEEHRRQFEEAARKELLDSVSDDGLDEEE